MKHVLFGLLAVVLTTNIIGQELWKTTSSKVHFFSEAPLENIEAVNEGTIAMYKTTTKDLAIAIPTTKFEFEKELMKEHFNENYLESGKYPNSTFKGKLDEEINFKKSGKYETSATGTLTIHGVAQKRTIKGTLTVEKGKATMKTRFKVKLADHDIEIPQIVFQNIAEVVDVDATLVFQPKK